MIMKRSLPRSMRPPIPEPRPRVGPKGVSSGVSFRKLPNSSLRQITNICNHYEAKCTGKYSSLASRYVVQMGKEIKQQIAILEEIEERELDRRTARELRETLQEWKKHFGEKDSDCIASDNCCYGGSNVTSQPLGNDEPNCNEQNGTKNTCDQRNSHTYLSPIEVKEEMNRLRNQVQELKHRLALTQDEAEQTKRILETELDNHAEAFRKSASIDRKRQQTTLAAMQEKCDAEIQIADKEVTQAKLDAKSVIENIRKSAEASISEVIANIDVDKKRNEQEIMKERKKLKTEYEVKLKELDFHIENQEKLQREAVNKECRRLKHQHAIELAEARKHGILKGCKAVLGDRTSSKVGRLSGYCAACGDVTCKEIDNDDLRNMSEVNRRECKCKEKNFLRFTDSCFHELHSCGKENECKWLKIRVLHLEDMVRTLVDTIKENEKRRPFSARHCNRS